MPSPSRASEQIRIAVAAIAWSGVLLQLWLSLKNAAGNGMGWPMGLVGYFSYFTVITNWFVAMVCTRPSLAWKSTSLAWLGRPSVTGCATTAILLVCLVYHFRLREYWDPQGLLWMSYLIMHYVVPAGMLVWWWLQTRDSVPGWDMPLRWCSYPLIYLGYVMIRGEFTGAYPYPFIDVERIGHLRTLLNAAGMISIFGVLGFAVLGIAHAAKRRDGRALQPVEME